MMRLKYLFLTLFFLRSLGSFAQLPDDVKPSQSFIDVLRANLIRELTMPFELNNINISAKIPICVHIIKNIAGSPGVGTGEIVGSLATANSYFKHIGIQFTVDSFNYINDYHYSYVTRNHYKTELLTLFAQKNRINLFIVDSIKMGSFRSYGFTYFPDMADSNFIFLDKAYVNGKYLTTMLGHFMGLLSTHDVTGGGEDVSELNCATGGDFICDTYADPNLLGAVDINCEYTGTRRDNYGKYYMPSAANIMSNTLDHCKCIFTILQYRRMYYYYLNFRQHITGPGNN